MKPRAQRSAPGACPCCTASIVPGKGRRRVDRVWWCTDCAIPAQAALRTRNATSAAEVRRISWEGAQRTAHGEVAAPGPRIHDPEEAAERDRLLRFVRARATAAEGPARPTRARSGHLSADRVAARLLALARAFEREELPIAVILHRLRGLAAFAPEPLATVLHTLAKGAARGAHRERVRLAPVRALVRVPLQDDCADEDQDAEGDGHQLRLSLAAVSR